jgi:predicted amidohydrolase YtcJ
MMTIHSLRRFAASALALAVAGSLWAQAVAPDAIYFGGKVVTVDAGFALREAFAVRGGRIVAVGSNAEIRRLATDATRQVDLGGRTVLPGLIDSHVHAASAAMAEYDHPVPTMETIRDVLDYVAARAKVVPAGEWIEVRQVFITRLQEARFPTRAELDTAAPRHPVAFHTGPDTMLNTLGLERCAIDANFRPTDGGPGHVEKNAQGEVTGLVRGLQRYLKTPPEKRVAEAEHQKRIRELFRDYNQAGLTTVCDRGATVEGVARYTQVRDDGALTVRLALSHTFPTVGSLDTILGAIDQIAASPLRRDDGWLHLLGTKIWLDGGMLTGSAYMLRPWGVSEMYGIRDANYRGVLNVPPDRLDAMVARVAGHGMQFTAHSVGDGAVTALLDAYERLQGPRSARELRMNLTHSNFMTREAVERAAKLGVTLDVQPIWLYLDTRTLVRQFGYDRLRYFQPLKSIFAAGGMAGGGSDHMLKIGDRRAINPYNPFLAMWTTITRGAKWYEGQLHPEEALTRRQAIEFYTRNNAYLLFWEKEIGSLEVGKRADFIVVDRDPLECPIDELKDTQVLQTWLEGRLVYERAAK